jgi:hypothetical protein
VDYSLLDDYDVIKDKIYEIDRLYSEFATWSKCRVIRFCVDGLTPDEEMSILRSHIPDFFRRVRG